MQQARLRHGYTLFARELVPGWVALAVLLVAWGGARFLKKTGRLKGG
jgi:hypothetical protein